MKQLDPSNGIEKLRLKLSPDGDRWYETPMDFGVHRYGPKSWANTGDGASATIRKRVFIIIL